MRTSLRRSHRTTRAQGGTHMRERPRTPADCRLGARAHRRGRCSGRRRCRRQAHHRSGQGARQLAEPRPHLLRAALQPADEDRHRQRRQARARLVARHQEPHHARRGGHADRGGRGDLHHRRLEPRPGRRGQDRQAAVGVRSANPRRVRRQGLLRHRQPWRGRVGRQGVPRRLRRPADRARRQDRQASCGRRSPSTSRRTTPSPVRRVSSKAR